MDIIKYFNKNVRYEIITCRKYPGGLIQNIKYTTDDRRRNKYGMSHMNVTTTRWEDCKMYENDKSTMRHMGNLWECVNAYSIDNPRTYFELPKNQFFYMTRLNYWRAIKEMLKKNNLYIQNVTYQ